jgi:hypothetical protein
MLTGAIDIGVGQACNNITSTDDMRGTSSFSYQLTVTGLYELHIYTNEGVSVTLGIINVLHADLSKLLLMRGNGFAAGTCSFWGYQTDPGAARHGKNHPYYTHHGHCSWQHS